MGLSIVFLIIYYLVFSNNTTNQDKIFFSIFFSISYIAFLTLNILEGIKNEKKNKKKTFQNYIIGTQVAITVFCVGFFRLSIRLTVCNRTKTTLLFCARCLQ